MESLTSVNHGIDVAAIFYEKSLASQRRMVDTQIREAMSKGNPVVKLPTCVYTKISAELRKMGWEEEIHDEEMYEDDGVSYFYPVCLDGTSRFPELDEKGVFVAAEEFYKVTLANQQKDLSNALADAIINGFSEVKLPYKVYPAVISEMEKKDWGHGIWYANLDTKEECSMFYPICGYDEEE